MILRVLLYWARVFSSAVRRFAGVSTEHATDGEQTGARTEMKNSTLAFFQSDKFERGKNLKGVKVKVVKLRPKTK